MQPPSKEIRCGSRGEPVLCIHGLASTPSSLRPLVEHLGTHDRQAVAPTLSGHGRKLKDLARSNWHEWYTSADRALTALGASPQNPVSLIGSSMGGLIALELAIRRPQDVAALVLMATPLHLPGNQEKWIRWAKAHLPKWLLRNPLLSWPKIPVMGSHATVRKHLEPSLRAVPISAAVNLIDLMDYLRPRLHEVKAPTLLIYSRADKVTPFSVALTMSTALSSAHKEIQKLTASKHSLCLDVECQAVFETITNFLTRHHTQ